MNKLNKNIIYVGDDSYYQNKLKLSNINNQFNKNYSLNLIRIESLKDIKGKQGFILILTLDDLYYQFPNLIDIYNPDVYEIDRNLRKIFKNFQYVIIISIEEFDYGHIPFSNIYIEYANKYFTTDEGLNLLIDRLYNEYISKKEINLSKIKKDNIEKLRNYIGKKKKEYIPTKEIIEELNINEKWLERYMKDMNNLYHNIGYNKRKRAWYKIKNNYKI